MPKHLPPSPPLPTPIHAGGTVNRCDFTIIAPWLGIWPVTFKTQPSDVTLSVSTLASCLMNYRAFWDASGHGRQPFHYWLEIMRRINASFNPKTKRYRKVRAPLLWDARGRRVRGSDKDVEFAAARLHHIEHLWRTGQSRHRPVLTIARSDKTGHYYAVDGNHTLLSLALFGPDTRPAGAPWWELPHLIVAQLHWQ